MAKIKSSKDIIMLLLYAHGTTGKTCEAIEGQTRLMKMVFLFKKELAGKLDKIVDVSALPSFEAYDFGPFSAEVYGDLEFLVNNDFVAVEGKSGKHSEEEKKELEYWQATLSSSDEAPTEFAGRKFALTDLGKSFVEEELIKDTGITASQLGILAKRDVALTWCEQASDHAKTCGGKPWTYLLIPHDVIADNMTIDGLAKWFSGETQKATKKP